MICHQRTNPEDSERAKAGSQEVQLVCDAVPASFQKQQEPWRRVSTYSTHVVPRMGKRKREEGRGREEGLIEGGLWPAWSFVRNLKICM